MHLNRPKAWTGVKIDTQILAALGHRPRGTGKAGGRDEQEALQDPDQRRMNDYDGRGNLSDKVTDFYFPRLFTDLPVSPA